jgi:gamma-glutamylcysteine synthetase
MTHVTRCSTHGCPEPPTTWLKFRGQDGHVHDCARDAWALREFCDVTESGPITDGECPVADCTTHVTAIRAPTPLRENW